MAIADSITTTRNNTGFINSIKRNAIVKPENFKGIAGYLFDVTENDGIQLQSDITDHYIEDNSAINDHIAIKPEIVTVTGYVSELSETQNDLIKNLPAIADKLTILQAYLPEFSVSITEAYAKTKTAITTVLAAKETAENIYELFTQNDPREKLTKQSEAFSFFYNMWQARQIFTVDTFYKTFTNMAILNMDVLQTDSEGISEFNITFKKLRFAKTLTTTIDQGRRINQASPKVNKGSSRGKEVESSAAFKIFKRVLP